MAAGFTTPKPLIPVGGVPMTRLVISNLRPRQPHRFIFLLLEEHLNMPSVAAQLQCWAPGCVLWSVDRVTEGPACTALLAAPLINNRDPLMIANCDQWVDIDINDYLAVLDDHDVDGLVMTMKANHPKWSYARLSPEGAVTELVEKRVVSDEATVGIYNFQHGQDFVGAARQMIRKNLRVNGEFYVAPAYNELISDGARLRLHNVGKEYDGMYGLGTPEDLAIFESLPVCAKAVKRTLEERCSA